MCEERTSRVSDSLLHSEVLEQMLGGDAMQILRCGICMDFFDVPIVLPCGHTFCLHCLTEMCKHANRNCVLGPLKDVRIGCPNCRVLIYAAPILERNVTCNFVIQSLIESLRVRPRTKTISTESNTDEVRVGDKIRSLTDIELSRLLEYTDRASQALENNNILDHSFLEVEEIRQKHLDHARQLEKEEAERAMKQKRAQQLYLNHMNHLRQQQQQLRQRSQIGFQDILPQNYVSTSSFPVTSTNPQSFPTNHHHIHLQQQQQQQQQHPNRILKTQQNLSGHVNQQASFLFGLHQQQQQQPPQQRSEQQQQQEQQQQPAQQQRSEQLQQTIQPNPVVMQAMRRATSSSVSFPKPATTLSLRQYPQLSVSSSGLTSTGSIPSNDNSVSGSGLGSTSRLMARPTSRLASFLQATSPNQPETSRCLDHLINKPISGLPCTSGYLVAGTSRSIGQGDHVPSSLASRLDNDPAVMSYSCKVTQGKTLQ